AAPLAAGEHRQPHPRPQQRPVRRPRGPPRDELLPASVAPHDLLTGRLPAPRRRSRRGDAAAPRAPLRRRRRPRRRPPEPRSAPAPRRAAPRAARPRGPVRHPGARLASFLPSALARGGSPRRAPSSLRSPEQAGGGALAGGTDGLDPTARRGAAALALGAPAAPSLRRAPAERSA